MTPVSSTFDVLLLILARVLRNSEAVLCADQVHRDKLSGPSPPLSWLYHEKANEGMKHRHSDERMFASGQILWWCLTFPGCFKH